MELLQTHDWPGNIRELANTVAQALLLSKGTQIEIEDLPDRIIKSCSKKDAPIDTTPASSPEKGSTTDSVDDIIYPGELLKQYEQVLLENINFRQGFNFEQYSYEINAWRDQLLSHIINEALNDTYGNQVKAAKLLGITPRALRYHLHKSERNNGTG